MDLGPNEGSGFVAYEEEGPEMVEFDSGITSSRGCKEKTGKAYDRKR